MIAEGERRAARLGDPSMGPRAALRVTEVLLALADRREGSSLDILSEHIGIPRASLYRLLRELESAQFVSSEKNGYRLGPASQKLANRIMAQDEGAPIEVKARPHLVRLAQATHETVMLAIYDPAARDIVYADVIDSQAPVRFSVPVGDRRSLYSAAAGKAVFCFLSNDERDDYMNEATFTRFTPHTPGREDIAASVTQTRGSAVAFDWDGSFVGASAIASPVFGRDGKVMGSVSVAGPTERICARQSSIEQSVLATSADVSHLAGFVGSYPPPG